MGGGNEPGASGRNGLYAGNDGTTTDQEVGDMEEGEARTAISL